MQKGETYLPYSLYFDPTMIILIPGIIFALLAQHMINSAYRKYSQVFSRRGLTSTAAARAILVSGGADDVRIEGIAGQLSDHYSPKEKVLRLSQGVKDSTSLAAIGIAAHEAGHALQDRDGYAFLRLRGALVPVVNFGSRASLPLLFLGMLIQSQTFVYIGLGAYFLAVVFQLITLPVEFDASRRAIAQLQAHNLLDMDELPAAKRILRAAALTYVAAAASSILQFIRLLAIAQGGNRRRNR